MLVPALLFIKCALLIEGNCPHRQSSKNDSLILLHVIFRHGNRTTNGPGELYPKDPYINETYYPVGLGQLTNTGKLKEYNIGKSLRLRYNAFLGDYYIPEMLDAWTTNVNRTKASLELVLAGLFQPKGQQIWNSNINWQPVPYNYLRQNEDKVLQGTNCPNFGKLYQEHSNSMQRQQEFSKYRETFDYISENTGLNVTRFADVFGLYFGLSTEEEWGFKLPQWTETVWPEVITDLAIKEYSVRTGTTNLRRMASGYFLKKLILDTQDKINGAAQKRKLYLYSAHESNLAQLLTVLDVFSPPHVPNYGSYIIFEVHRISDLYGIKIYYENYDAEKPKLLKLPACDDFCPFDKFISLVDEYIPDDQLCGT